MNNKNGLPYFSRIIALTLIIGKQLVAVDEHDIHQRQYASMVQLFNTCIYRPIQKHPVLFWTLLCGLGTCASFWMIKRKKITISSPTIIEYFKNNIYTSNNLVNSYQMRETTELIIDKIDTITSNNLVNSYQMRETTELTIDKIDTITSNNLVNSYQMRETTKLTIDKIDTIKDYLNRNYKLSTTTQTILSFFATHIDNIPETVKKCFSNAKVGEVGKISLNEELDTIIGELSSEEISQLDTLFKDLKISTYESKFCSYFLPILETNLRQTFIQNLAGKASKKNYPTVWHELIYINNGGGYTTWRMNINYTYQPPTKNTSEERDQLSLFIDNNEELKTFFTRSHNEKGSFKDLQTICIPDAETWVQKFELYLTKNKP